VLDGRGVVGCGFPAELVWSVELNVNADSASARVLGVSSLPFSPLFCGDDMVDGETGSMAVYCALCGLWCGV